MSVLSAAVVWPGAAAAAGSSERIVKYGYDGSTTMTVKRSGQGRIIDRSGEERKVITFRLRPAALTSLKQRIAAALIRQAQPRYEQNSEYPIVCGPASKVINARGRTIRIAYGVYDLPRGLKRLVKRLNALLDRYAPFDGAQSAQRCRPTHI
jgi:hypothetical protein